MLGQESRDTVSQVLLACFEGIPFEKLDSSINLLKFALSNKLTEAGLVVTDQVFGNLLAKF